MTLPLVTVRTGQCVGIIVCFCVGVNVHMRVLIFRLFSLFSCITGHRLPFLG